MEVGKRDRPSKDGVDECVHRRAREAMDTNKILLDEEPLQFCYTQLDVDEEGRIEVSIVEDERCRGDAPACRVEIPGRWRKA